MEVHAHTHTARKRWTHYIWEFLMLFLAVFCGFLAEYQLEHKIEKERGRQYLRSFVEDLETDTTVFSDLIKQYEEKIAVLSTLVNCFDAVSNKKAGSDSCVLKLFIYSSHFPDLIYTDRTLQQLKNAGGLRLIARADADSIIEYDKLLRLYQKTEGTSYQEIQSAIRNSIYSLYNFGKTIKAEFDTSGPVDSEKTSNTSFLFSVDKELLNRYFNQLFFYYNGTLANLEDLQKINQRAKGLISFFYNKYNLK